MNQRIVSRTNIYVSSTWVISTANDVIQPRPTNAQQHNRLYQRVRGNELNCIQG